MSDQQAEPGGSSLSANNRRQELLTVVHGVFNDYDRFQRFVEECDAQFTSIRELVEQYREKVDQATARDEQYAAQVQTVQANQDSVKEQLTNADKDRQEMAKGIDSLKNLTAFLELYANQGHSPLVLAVTEITKPDMDKIRDKNKSNERLAKKHAKDVTQLQTDNESYLERVQNAEGKVEKLEEQLSDLTAALSEAKTRVSKLELQKIELKNAVCAMVDEKVASAMQSLPIAEFVDRRFQVMLEALELTN